MDKTTMNRRFLITAAAAAAVAVPVALTLGRPALARKLPDPRTTPVKTTDRTETAVLAGGCFWGIQAVFAHVKGVTRSVSGYCGGRVANPTYEQVGTGSTGHAEAVQITFDPRVVSYADLLQVFFSVGTDPTELNRQGPDVGTQYRNEIFYTSAEQKRVAEAYIAQLTAARVFPKAIVTKVTAVPAFYTAEAYHQDYAFLHPENPYIFINDLPKITDLKLSFPALWRDSPLRIASR